MLFTEEESAQLKTWIVKRIENTSDADSDVLADYVIALLKHDGDQAAVRKLCEDEIPDFLTEDSKAFLDDVFQAITYKSYVPGAPPAPKRTSTVETNTAVTLPPKPPSNNRKRGFEESAEFQGQDDYQQSERAYKQPRRGGWANNGDFNDNFPPGGMPNLPYYDPTTQFDPNNPMEAFMRMQAMGMSFPAMPDYSGHISGQQHRKRARCRDFDNKGFCSRGSSCAYDHGQESAYTQADYDMRGDSRLDVSQMNASGPPFFHDSPRGGRGGRSARGGKKNRGGKAAKGSRAAFSADGPVNDRSKTTIVIENIPEESFSEAQVSNFFTQFGNIQEVSMQSYKHLAIVKYDSWEAANAAYRSPKVIFDNRFVKVFWYKDETEKPGRKDTKVGENGFAEASKRREEASPADEVDTEDFQRRQEEAQKLHQERESKRSELEAKRQELEKQQHALLAKHRVETEKLQAKLLAKSGTGDDGDSKTADGNGTSAGSTGMLRARLALLEQEAKILGIKPENPNAEDDGSINGSFQGSYRGRGSRGRGAYSRGGYVPRGRGSFRGNGTRHAAYAQYSIDNRPKKVAITGADFTAPEKDEALRHFLLSNGEFESVDSGAEKTTVSFQDRKTAEKFYFSLQGKEIPGISGNLELSWVNTPLPPAATGTAPSSSAGLSAADTAAADGIGIGGSVDTARDGGEERKPVATMRQDEPRREVNMDYEMPDEEIW